LEKHGLVDLIVERAKMRSTLSDILGYLVSK
jgi:acetyl-CoA carboxylase beta subunit